MAPKYYYDETTGEYIPEDQFDPEKYEVVSGPVQAEDDRSFLSRAYDSTVGLADDVTEYLGKAGASGLFSSVGGIGGAVKALGEAQMPSKTIKMFPGIGPAFELAEQLSGQNITSLFDRAATEAGEGVSDYTKELQEPLQEYRSELGPVGTLGHDVIGGVTSSILSLLSGPFAPAVMTAQVGGNAYNRRVDQGVDPETALTASALQAPITYLTSKIPLAKSLEEGPLLQRIMATAPREAIQESIEETADIIGDLATIEDYKVTPLEAAGQIAYAGVVGLGAGTLTPAVVDAARKTSDVIRGKTFLEQQVETNAEAVQNSEAQLVGETQVATPVRTQNEIDGTELIVLEPTNGAETITVDEAAREANTAERMAELRALEFEDIKVKTADRIASTIRGDERTFQDVLSEITEANPKVKTYSDTLPTIDKFLNGYLHLFGKDVNIPGVSFLVGGIRKGLSYPSTLRRIDSRAGAAWDTGVNYGRKTAADVTQDITQYAPFSSLPDKTNVKRELVQAANVDGEIDYESLSQKLTESELRAFKSVRDYLSETAVSKLQKHLERDIDPRELYEVAKGWETLSSVEAANKSKIPLPLLTAARDAVVQGQTDPVNAMQKLQTIAGQIGNGGAQVVQTIAELHKTAPRALEARFTIQSMKNRNYLPAGRFGDYYTSIVNKTGDVLWFRRHATSAEAAAQHKLFLEKGMLQDGDKVKIGQFRQPQDSAFDKNMPLTLAMQLAQIDPVYAEKLANILDLPPVGFAKHLTKSKMIPGRDIDIERALTEYTLSLNSFINKTESKAEYDKILNTIDTRSPLHKYLSDFKDYVYDNGDGEFVAKFNKAVTVYFLGMRVSSALVNLTQQLTTTYGSSLTLQKQLLGKSSDVKAMKDFIAAEVDALDFLVRGEKLAKRNKELAKYLEARVNMGDLEAQQLRDALGYVNTGKKAKLNVIDLTLLPFGAAEKLNRLQAYTLGFKLAQDAKYSPEMADQIATDFVMKTQFTYGREDTPQWFRGKGKSLYVLRGFMGHYLRYLRNAYGDKNYKELTRSLGAIVGLAGVMGLPFAGLINTVAQMFGVEAKKDTRELLNGAFGDDEDARAKEATLGTGILYGVPAALGPFSMSSTAGMGSQVDLEATLPEIAFSQVGGVGAGLVMRVYQGAALAREGKYYRALERISPAGVSAVMNAVRGTEFTAPLGEPPIGWATQNYNVLVADPTAAERIWQGIGFPATRVQIARDLDQYRRNIIETNRKASTRLNQQIAIAMVNQDYEAVVELITKAAEDYAIAVAKGKAEEAAKPNFTAIRGHFIKMTVNEAAKLKTLPKPLRGQYLRQVDLATAKSDTE